MENHQFKNSCIACGNRMNYSASAIGSLLCGKKTMTNVLRKISKEQHKKKYWELSKDEKITNRINYLLLHKQKPLPNECQEIQVLFTKAMQLKNNKTGKFSMKV